MKEVRFPLSLLCHDLTSFFLKCLQMRITIEKFVKITNVLGGGVFQSVKMRDKPQKLFARVSILNKQVLM